MREAQPVTRTQQQHLRRTTGHPVTALDQQVVLLEDGRPVGPINIALRKAPDVIGVMGMAGAISPEATIAATAVALARQEGDKASLNLQFQAGMTCAR